MNQIEYYDNDFYAELEKSVAKSSKHLVPIICNNINPKSVIDFGCGNGIWLKAFENAGIKNYCGIDGDYVKKEIFKADFNNFIPKNLNHEINLNKKFDLVLSLEVAEHLNPESSEIFIKSLCNHSDSIIFSAAIPAQKGTNHINLNFQSYWCKIFQKYGYQPFDIIRPEIWYDTRISYWYRQNIILYKKNDSTTIKNIELLDKTHPELDFFVQSKNTLLSQFLLHPKYVFRRFLKKRILK